jgi:mono/diheme cytochrome c family protein
MRRLWIAATGLLALVCVAQAAALVYLRARAGWQRAAADTAIERGRAVAEAMGCFGCHGPGGAAPIANPGARYGEVPAWTGGTWMLWNRDEADVRAWIRDGHPPGRAPDREALIPMPAYDAHLSAVQLDDLVAYVLAVSQFGRPQDERAAEGREVAARFGCFGCHGPEGRGLVRNPGSLTGYVPPWDGSDYAELVQSDDEFRQWVANGISDRLRAQPAARHLLEQAPIRMPAYGERIGDAELEALRAYVSWLRRSPRSAAARD